MSIAQIPHLRCSFGPEVQRKACETPWESKGSPRNESTQQSQPLESSLLLRSSPKPVLPAKSAWLNYA